MPIYNSTVTVRPLAIINPDNMDRRKTLILAEPVSALSSDLETFFTENGYQSIPARSLEETLLTLQNQKIDALVLDAALLREDFGFIPVIKGIEKKLPIIICAASNTPELEAQIRKQGILDRKSVV